MESLKSDAARLFHELRALADHHPRVTRITDSLMPLSVEGVDLGPNEHIAEVFRVDGRDVVCKVLKELPMSPKYDHAAAYAARCALAAL